MDDNISMGIANNIDDNILFIFYMDGNIHLCYNYAMMEEVCLYANQQSTTESYCKVC